MFESAELGRSTSKEEFQEALPDLRLGLINAQFDLREAGFSVVLLLVGDDRLGCDEVLDRLHEWLDARFIDANIFLRPTDEERERPRAWRYWRALPPKGRIGFFVGAWAARMVADRLVEGIDDAEFSQRLDRVRSFERSLTDDGTLLLKFWLHIPKEKLSKRLKKAKKDAELEARLEEEDFRIHELYDEAMPIAESLIRETSTAGAPWEIIESTDRRYRDLTVAKKILAALEARLAAPPLEGSDPPVAAELRSEPDVLEKVDLSASIDHDEYEERLGELQTRLMKLSRRARRKRLSSVLVFEGWDAAGKGGTIRRITRPLSARDYKVIPISAPTDEERARHYLWRFWRTLPRAGRMAIYDRSWYGRVLVERVEGFAEPKEWRRAYEEINFFETELIDHGIPVIKFWLHIDPEEQLRRFRARVETAYKKYKITDDDYRNRDKWSEYVAAVEEMVARTSTGNAPWHLISINDKRWGRLQVLERVCRGLEEAL
jgi:polyphosphate:AMP phosphotransferase